MKITDLLSTSAIKINGSANSKEEVISKMVDLMINNGNIIDKEKYKRVVLEREKEGSTGIGEGIAIPHGKTDAVSKPGLAAMVIPDGVNFDSLDGQPAKLIFLIAAPDTKDNVHLDVLSRLSTLLMDPEFKNELLNAETSAEFMLCIDRAERMKLNETKRENNGYEILAITACPTGIAHTYMAAESLEKMGNQLGHKVKVETHGASGVKNKFTKEEIKNAKAVIIAADTKIDLSRFDGKKIVKAKVADGINKPKELIEHVLSPEAKTYHSSGKEKQDDNSGEQEGIGTQIYKHLMNGVTHMLPFVVGGGILIALAFLFDDYNINPSNFGMNTPLAAFFKTVGGAAFNVMLYILAGYIAMSIADRPGLAVGFVGGILAVQGTTFASLTDNTVTLVSSGFLGALIAGFVGGYIMVLLRKLFDKLPSALEGLKPILLFPVCGILIMGVVMIAVNPVVGAINTGLNNFLSSMSGTSSILLGAVLGGMMSIDMGGPFNKAAYVFGTAQLTVANAGPEQYAIMAAVMAGGMVPPLAIALCTTFFKNRFTESERKSGVVNYIMGLSFITEGAIPFAAGDPIHILPPCIVGSAVAGALSMAFKCGLPAPHGGIFVIGVITNPVQYLISVVVGAVIGMIVMSFTKKPLNK